MKIREGTVAASVVIFASVFLVVPGVRADSETTGGGMAHSMHGPRADSHAPIGVMAEHMHSTGELMFSYRFMSMDMAGNLKGSSKISPETIVTTEPNRFFGNPNMPPTLRVVPLDMSMDMHMLGLMYAPTNRLTMMLMANYIDRDMNHVTYMGGTGTTVLGNFRTSTSGWGDTSLMGMVKIKSTAKAKIHAILGVSLPTGSTDETGQVLTPMNMQPTVRLPYPMQLGSGTVDSILGVSYSGFGDRWGWGGQWRSIFRTGDNDEDYSLGNETRLMAWLSYLISNPVSASLRVEHYDRGNISGIDPNIMLPVQTADPSRQGASRTDLAFGLNLAGQHGLRGWRLGLEFLVPLSQDLDGPQLETDEQLIIGIQKSL